jgi:hypothetical protein
LSVFRLGWHGTLVSILYRGQNVVLSAKQSNNVACDC